MTEVSSRRGLPYTHKRYTNADVCERIRVPHKHISATALLSLPRPPHPSKTGRSTSTQSFLGGRCRPRRLTAPHQNPQCTSSMRISIYAKIRHDRIGVPHYTSLYLICEDPSRPSSPSLALHIRRKWEGQHNHSGAAGAAGAASASCRQSRSEPRTRPIHLSSDARLVRAVERSCRQRPRQRRPRPPARPQGWCPRPQRRSSDAP